MAAIPVIVKHQGKKYNVEIDPTSIGEVFKFQLYSLTGVEPERQKILVKGGQLKDDTDMSKIAAKPGMTIMMMGTPSGDGNSELVRPKEKTKFVEDMTEAERAQQEGATPAGLQNLGNTCYLNSTLQTLRAVPELQQELAKYTPTAGPSGATLGNLGLGLGGGSLDLVGSLRDLYKQMSETEEGFPPLVFLNALRAAFPQFAERSKTGHGYAQQDAEEAWSQIVTQLQQKLKAGGGEAADSSFVDRYMGGRFATTLEPDEQAAKDAGEVAVEGSESFLKLSCHIGQQTNHLRDGLLAALEEKIEKTSPALGREAVYTKKSRISRLPKYLTVHFVRFFWKREIQKKAKIMRKVTFPHELDILEFCTDDLRLKMIPVRDRLREIIKDQKDVERSRKRQKLRHDKEVADKAIGAAPVEPAKKDDKPSGSEDVEMTETYKTDAEHDAEQAAKIAEAVKELNSLVDQDLAKDEGANQSGLYELRGIVTHQGASADSGHYTAYVKKQGPLDPKTGKRGEEDGKWWWFNDDKVSEVESDKIDTLSGGGESHSALILLYRSIPLPTVDGSEK